MTTFTTEEHRDALIRRRIKFVAEKGAMARLFKAGTNEDLQRDLFRCIRLSDLAAVQTRDEYDRWLIRTVERDCWAKCSRNGIDQDRWAYFAKLVNIIVYEIVVNRELFSEHGWQRIRSFLHVPIDWNVTHYVSQLDTSFSGPSTLKGMTKTQYLDIQQALRRLASQHSVPPIWFEAAYTE
jgi:hypothetical protein